MALVVETVDISKATNEELKMPPGPIEVRFYLTEPISENDLQAIHDHLISAQVDVRDVYQTKSNGLCVVERDPCLHLTEFNVWEDNNPWFAATNYTDYALNACRLVAPYQTTAFRPGLMPLYRCRANFLPLSVLPHQPSSYLRLSSDFPSATPEKD